MNCTVPAGCTAFEDSRRIASGSLEQVARMVKELIGEDYHRPVLIFDDSTSEPVEIDFRGSVEDVLDRLNLPGNEGEADNTHKRGPGRPRLGVVSREVTLLPRHWDWLNGQSGGASVALRRLVEEARRLNSHKDRVRLARDAAYRFMAAMAGDLAGFEEATRALYAGDRLRFDSLVADWPVDIRDHAKKVSDAAFSEQEN